MAVKALFVVCASALFIQSITAQCSDNVANIEVNNLGVANGLGLASNYASGLSAAGVGLANLGNNGFATNGFFANGLGNGYGFGNGNRAQSSGGAFVVTSSSPVAPTGLSVFSENAIEGPLSVYGFLPFLTAIGVEGQIPANGAAGVQYGCGNGNIGIVSETSAPAGYNGLAGSGLTGPGLAGPGLAGPGLAGPGLVGPGHLGNAGLIGPALNGPISRGVNGGIY